MTVPVALATRGSALARWQTDLVASSLRAVDPAVRAEALVVETTGDRRADQPLWELGGKGVFVKEVQAAVLDGRARAAVHSAKDLPSTTPAGLVLAALPPRADPRDALVGATLDGLAPGAPIATGSVRRRAQLAAARPDLTFTGLRGNIATRLERIPDGGAIVMAAAALDRLGLAASLAVPHEVLDPAVVLPQSGQGAIAVECAEEDAEMRALLAVIDDEPTRRAVEAERAFLAELGGDCDLPAGAHGRIEGGEVVLDALIASLDGHVILRAAERGPDASSLGSRLARFLLDDRGGASLLEP